MVQNSPPLLLNHNFPLFFNKMILTHPLLTKFLFFQERLMDFLNYCLHSSICFVSFYFMYNLAKVDTSG